MRVRFERKSDSVRVFVCVYVCVCGLVAQVSGSGFADGPGPEGKKF